jgi:hypothetical protein
MPPPDFGVDSARLGERGSESALLDGDIFEEVRRAQSEGGGGDGHAHRAARRGGGWDARGRAAKRDCLCCL